MAIQTSNTKQIEYDFAIYKASINVVPRMYSTMSQFFSIIALMIAAGEQYLHRPSAMHTGGQASLVASCSVPNMWVWWRDANNDLGRHGNDEGFPLQLPCSWQAFSGMMQLDMYGWISYSLCFPSAMNKK